VRRPIAGAAAAEPQATPASAWKRWRWYALEFGLVIAALVVTRLLSIFTWTLPDGDVTEYHDYALTFWTVRPWFHALPVEYPPLAIVPFSLTMLPPIGDYHVIFAIWMGALVLLGYIGFLRYSTRTRAIVYTGYLVVGAAAVLLSRFDIVPALVTLAALWAAERRQFGYAYALIAVGILLKLYPGFLLPVVMIEHWRVATARAIADGRDTYEAASNWWRAAPLLALRRLRERPAARRVLRGAALCVGIVALGFICALILNPVGALSGFGYASARPMQVESTPASILWLGTLFGIPAAPDYSFVSLNYVGALDIVLKPLSALALLAGCLWVYWRQGHGRLTIGQAFVACLCAVLVTNKIFSPQYLIWVLPVVAYVEGFDVLWVAICLLTTLDFPIIYQMRHPIWTVTFSWQFMPVLAVRNGLLLWVTIRAIVRRRRRVTAAPGMLLGAGTLTRDDTDEGRETAEPALAGQADR
jgi:hypothetical protein